MGYVDKWDWARGWEIRENNCRSCPADAPEGSLPDECHTHHQSPIDLQRNRGLTDHEMETECIDWHWMKYEDSSCTWQDLIDADAITVERHALRVTQPVDDELGRAGNLRLDCPGPPRSFGRIDFSKGFADWWFLSHIDFHVPSEHTQDGKRYSAEAQMYHFYSEESGNAAGNENEVRLRLSITFSTVYQNRMLNCLRTKSWIDSFFGACRLFRPFLLCSWRQSPYLWKPMKMLHRMII